MVDRICIVCKRSHDELDNSCDYEPCGDCGFDHAYEPEEARLWHSANLEYSDRASDDDEV